MRKIREVLRLSAAGRSQRLIAQRGHPVSAVGRIQVGTSARLSSTPRDGRQITCAASMVSVLRQTLRIVFPEACTFDKGAQRNFAFLAG
jgi:hypothetical protein